MTQTAEPKGFFITPVQVFVAYAEMRDNEGAFPRTQGYYEKRWRLIAGLFEIPFNLGDYHGFFKEGAFRLLESLLDCRKRASKMVPNPILQKGQWLILDKEIYVSYQRSLSKKEAAIRYEYEQMGGELFKAIFPKVGKKHVAVSRLFELGLPLTAPDSHQEECDWIDEYWDDEELGEPLAVTSKDDVTPEQMDYLRLSEENCLRAERITFHEMSQIRLRVMALEDATPQNVDEIIYNMPVAQYLDLAGDFPKISRVHFQPKYQPRPRKKWPENLPLPIYHERSLIISPLEYLMKELRSLYFGTWPEPRQVMGGWTLHLLPQELHEEASLRTPYPYRGTGHPSDKFQIRTKWKTAFEKNKVRLRIIEKGLASKDDVDEVIYKMPLEVFRDIASSFPFLSRVHFNPALKSYTK